MKKILVVDDESDIYLTLANVLLMLDGYVVHSFDDPVLALVMFRSFLSILVRYNNDNKKQ